MSWFRCKTSRRVRVKGEAQFFDQLEAPRRSSCWMAVSPGSPVPSFDLVDSERTA